MKHLLRLMNNPGSGYNLSRLSRRHPWRHWTPATLEFGGTEVNRDRQDRGESAKISASAPRIEVPVTTLTNTDPRGLAPLVNEPE
jgi:hypothetical protein